MTAEQYRSFKAAVKARRGGFRTANVVATMEACYEAFGITAFDPAWSRLVKAVIYWSEPR